MEALGSAVSAPSAAVDISRKRDMFGDLNPPLGSMFGKPNIERSAFSELIGITS
jgi:hypothetical protein